MMEVVVKGLGIILVKKIKRVKEKDKEVVRVVEEIKRVEIKALRGNEWETGEDLVLKEKRYMYQRIRN